MLAITGSNLPLYPQMVHYSVFILDFLIKLQTSSIYFKILPTLLSPSKAETQNKSCKIQTSSPYHQLFKG
jgi:hypothetical protein